MFFSQCASLSISSSPRGQHNTYISQAANNVRGGLYELFDVLERIEMFFRRLELYAEMPPTADTMDTTLQMMVNIVSILGIATREFKEGRLSG